MPTLNGLEATRRILRIWPQVKVLILTIHNAESIAHEALEAGARGFLLKSDAAKELNTAVETLARGGFYFTRRVTEMLAGSFLHATMVASERPPHLTPRESEMVRDFARGKTARQVAENFGVSIKTVESHRSNIMRKLDLHSVSELVLYAVRNKVITP